MRQSRLLRFTLCLAVLAGAAGAQDADEPTARIPRFSDYPFDQWAAAPERSAIKWEVHVLPAQLSIHERLISRLQVIVPGNELEKRRGRGELVVLARFEDSNGHQWRAGNRLNLTKLQPGVKSQELTFTIAAFVRPGEYKMQVALLDTQTTEYDFTRRTLHVAAIREDPLPDAWAGLPPVQVLSTTDGPDLWFLPEVRGLLHLPVRQGNPPPKIELLVNMTPSERSGNMATSLRRNMAAVIPALKVLSALNAKVQPPSAGVIDLTHQRIGFEAANAATLDWSALSKVLTENPPGIIDAKSLAAQASMRDYFAQEVARRAGGSGPARWLIVLSGPLAFGKQEDTPLPELTPDPNRHIAYLRFNPAFLGGGGRGGPPPGPSPDIQIAPAARVHGPLPGYTIAPPGAPGRGRGGMDAMYPDDLERILRPMGAQVFSVTTPEAFRKAVATLIEEMSVQ